jgi:YVTN family beta-propeller protein
MNSAKVATLGEPRKAIGGDTAGEIPIGMGQDTGTRPTASLAGYEVGRIAVGKSPSGDVFASSNGCIYVANYNSDNVSVINGSSDEVVANIAVGNGPSGGLAVDPVNGEVYVTNLGGTVSAIRDSTNRVVASITVPQPGLAAVDTATDAVFVSEETMTDVAIINGSTNKVVRTLDVGGIPSGIAYDPSNGYLYVANSGDDNLTVINGSTEKTVGSIGLGGNPSLVAPNSVLYDNTTGDLYVLQWAANDVIVIDPTTAKNLTAISVGTGPVGEDSDPSLGFVYVANGQSHNLTVINASTERVVGSIDLGAGAGLQGVAVEPVTQRVYAADYGTNNVSVVAPPLDVRESASASVVDPGVTVQFTANVSEGLVPYISYAWNFGDGSGANGPGANATHEFSRPGHFPVNVTVTDALGYRANASADVTVMPAPDARIPRGSSRSGDAGETVTFTENASLGTPPYTEYSWSGLPPGCPSARSAVVVCNLTMAGTYAVRVNVTDSEGVTGGSSPPLPFQVFQRPFAAEPVANRTSSDIGQKVGFSVTVSGGSGNFTGYTWDGLEDANCSGLSTDEPSCTFLTQGFVSLTVAVRDANGGSSLYSLPLSFEVSSLPVVGQVEVNRSTADVGQLVEFSATVTGGSGAYNYVWSGAPAGCIGSSNSLVTCVVESPGAWEASVVATDANGGRSTRGPSAALDGYSDPTVSTPVPSSTSTSVGQVVMINATASGGWGTYTYNWMGVPQGCTEAAGLATCRPATTGVFEISVRVTDGDGYSVTSSVSTLTVGPSPGNGNHSSTFLGLPSAEGYGVLGGVIVGIIVVIAVIVFFRGRGSKILPELANPPSRPHAGDPPSSP